MNRFFSLLAVTALVFGVNTAQAAITIGQTAPDFSIADVEGKELKLSDLKGKVVVLEWTNHACPFVEKHYKSGNMQKIQADMKAKGAVWVSINSSAKGKQGHVTPEQAADITKGVQSAADHFVLDHSGAIGKSYDAKVTPHMYVIGKDGKIAYMGAIDSNPSADPADIKGATNYVVNAVSEALDGKAVTLANTKPYGCGVKYAD